MVNQRSSARETILKLLKVRQSATVQSLAAVVRISQVAIRKHLDALEREGLVAATIAKVPRGRPTAAYSLTETGKALFPQSYRELAVGVLDELSSKDGGDLLRALFRGHNNRLAQLYQLRMASQPDLAGKLKELVQARDEDGYMATLEHVGKTILLKEHNCPIYEVAQRHPAACDCEAELLQLLLGAQIARRESLLDGAPACTYEIEDAEK